METNLSNYVSSTRSSSSSLLRALALNGFVQLIPPTNLQNVEQGRPDFSQEQFSNLHKFSDVQLHLNTFI